jgi:hypothetical protein
LHGIPRGVAIEKYKKIKNKKKTMSMTRTKGAAIWRLAQRRRSSSSRCFFLRVIIIHPRRAHINLASLVAREEWHVTRPFDPVSPKEN